MIDPIPTELDSRQIVFQPLYVPFASAIGVAFVLALFIWNYPSPNDPIGQKFVNVPEFWIWVFELGVMSAFLTVVFGPLWKQFVNLLKEQISNRDTTRKLGIGVMLLLGIAIYLALGSSIYWVVPSNPIRLVVLPQGHHQRVMIIYGYALLTMLPLIASTLLVYKSILDKTRQIQPAGQDRAKLFGMAADLLRYRRLLQNYLLIAGIVVSIVPVATASLRSILIAIGNVTEKDYPINIVMIYGLFFTAILILFYVPTHLLLTDSSRKLRDRLCPIDSLPTLEESLQKRKALDDWLETNIGLTQNLKAGIIALAPLVSSFVASVLGIQ